ncbi:MAG TPA: hypothetical protein VK956_02930, partial [Verrucomicrobium sp.]|nr:hypothetical protein [Verrucomicrobium sp.]
VGYRDTPFLQGTSPNDGRVHLHGFEFDTAMQLGKPVHPIFLTDEFPTDPVESESDPELQERHLYWRTFMRSDHLLYIPGDEAELTLHLQRMHLGPYYPSAMVSSSANSNSLSLPS